MKKNTYFHIKALLFALSAAVILNAFYYTDYQTTLLPGEYIEDGAPDLTAYQWSVPLVHDWNSDGKKDLLAGGRYGDAGQGGAGHVYYYENTGDDADPSFQGRALIRTCRDVCSPLHVPAYG